MKLDRAVGSTRAWPPLSASQQGEMDGALVMMQEAMDQVSLSGRYRFSDATPQLTHRRSFSSHQGHIRAAVLVGNTYFQGHGATIDRPRAVAAYKVAAEAGIAPVQCLLGSMYCGDTLGIERDYTQALGWYRKAAAQDDPSGMGYLGRMYFDGMGVSPSFRHAREYFERAIKLGNPVAVGHMQTLTEAIQEVTCREATSFRTTSRVRADPLFSFRTHSTPPSWTSGWRSAARAVRT